jgi:hypothetical protein
VTALGSREDICLRVLSPKTKPEGKRPLGKFRRRWEDSFKMNLQEVGMGYGLD